MNLRSRTFLAMLTPAVALACGEDAHPHTSVKITEPAAGATVALGATKVVAVAFAVDHFTLVTPGACAGAKDCGHAHLNIDGDACNDMSSPTNAPYNSASGTTSIVAKFALCPAATQVGPHTLLVSLHDEAHEDILADGKPVEASVMITTTP